MKVIISAAGTAGHINPGLAIANKIMEKDKNSEVIFLGTTRGLENDLVPKAGYDLKTIEAYALSKSIKNLNGNGRGFIQSRIIIRKFKPDILIGTGGYICGPTVLAAKRYGVPVLLHESNAFPGKAVQMLSQIADTICVSFKDAKNRLKNAKNIVVTGTPVKIKKKEYSDIEKNKILNDLGIKNTSLPIVLIFGGSQGAKRINEAILNIIDKRINKNYQIIWATGPKQYDVIKEELMKKEKNINNIENIKIIPYIYNMEEVMNISDIIVARSGAMTITEISNLGKSSILIPLPNVSQDHQLHNAKVLENINAAKIILDKDLNGNILNKEVEEIVLNKSKLQEMGQNAYTLRNIDVEEKIYNEILKLVETRKNKKTEVKK